MIPLALFLLFMAILTIALVCASAELEERNAKTQKSGTTPLPTLNHITGIPYTKGSP